MEFSSEFHRQYQILGKLGEGGMSRVYLAVQRSLDRRVAIKFMEARAFPEQEALKRFLGEARALARLDHPNILTLFDADAEGGNPYLVLEYVEGETVRQRLERDRKLSPESAATITLFVGRGLAYAHNVKIIHRDVKPENVLLADDGGVKLLDFGLAKLAESSAQVTSHGIIVGTPAYLSPEQILGTDLTPSSDIYCLGILFYEMLTGRTPFGDANDAKSLLARTKVDLPDLTAVGDLSAPLLNVLTKCLHRDPAQRYVEIHKAVGELELLLGVSADMRIRPTRKTRPARKMETPRTTVLPRRRRVPMRLAVGLFLTAFVIGALAAIGYGLRVSAAGRVAESIDVVAGVTGLRVRWVSAEEYAGVVVATGEGGESIVAEEPAPSRRHEVLIAGLKPGRSYALDVKAGRDSVCARLRAQTAVELRLPLQARLTVEGPDQASLDLELTVPVRLEVRRSAPEVAVAVRSGESTRPHLGLSGPGAGLGMMTLTVKASTVEGTAVTQVVSLTGPGDDLAAYLSSQELGRDLVDFEETISGANLSLESRRSRA
ncbi:MAG: protein kinase, partial [Candidatus Riflebacteria bacterium]|nr:protein kinase [Candidatus Riflebacteria bacterium]